MKKYLLVLALAFSASTHTAYAQCDIPNGGFENWEVIEIPTFLNDTIEYEKPLSWFSTIDALTLIFATDTSNVVIRKTSVAHSGSFALRLKTDGMSSFGDSFMERGEVCDDPPSSLSGYLRFNGAASDSAIIGVVFNDTIADSQDTSNVAGGGFFSTSGTTDSYTAFSVDINYTDISKADSFLVVIYVSNNSGGNVSLLLDDLTFSGTSSVVENAAEIGLNVFPNPSTGEVTIDLGDTPNETRLLNVYNTSGKRVFQTNLMRTGQESVNLSSLPDGLYVLQMLSDGQIRRERILIAR